MVEETFTYEDLYELLRAERTNTDLQVLSREQLANIRTYLKAKMTMLRRLLKSEKFADSEKREKLQAEADNAERAVRDLYERRERKIISRALFTLRSAQKVKDTTNMLPAEEKLYADLLNVLLKHQERFVGELSKADIEPKEIKKQPELEGRLVRFVEAVPELVSSDLVKYGPFAKEDVARMPEELAGLLLKQKKVEELKNENS